MLLPDLVTLERPLIGLDLETTSTNVMEARIVEIGLEIMRPGKPIKEYRTLVNPEVPIPPGATAVHNITNEMVKDAPKFADLADNLLRGLNGADFIGYSVRFDLGIIARAFKRCRKVWDYEDAAVIDALRIWQAMMPRSLEDAANEFLTKEEKAAASDAAHTALGDVKWATRVAAGQLQRWSQLPRNLRQLHDVCWPGWFDAEGKLKWRDDELCFSFGEHRDRPLSKVPKDYLAWVIKKDFSEKVKQVCRDAIKGVFPCPPGQT